MEALAIVLLVGAGPIRKFVQPSLRLEMYLARFACRTVFGGLVLASHPFEP